MSIYGSHFDVSLLSGSISWLNIPWTNYIKPSKPLWVLFLSSSNTSITKLDTVILSIPKRWETQGHPQSTINIIQMDPRRAHRGHRHGEGGHRCGDFPSRPPPCTNPRKHRRDHTHEQDYWSYVDGCLRLGISGPIEMAEVLSTGGGPFRVYGPEFVPRALRWLKHYQLVPQHMIDTIRYNYKYRDSGRPPLPLLLGISRGGARVGGMWASSGHGGHGVHRGYGGHSHGRSGRGPYEDSWESCC